MGKKKLLHSSDLLAVPSTIAKPGIKAQKHPLLLSIDLNSVKVLGTVQNKDNRVNDNS